MKGFLLCNSVQCFSVENKYLCVVSESDISSSISRHMKIDGGMVTLTLRAMNKPHLPLGLLERYVDASCGSCFWTLMHSSFCWSLWVMSYFNLFSALFISTYSARLLDFRLDSLMLAPAVGSCPTRCATPRSKRNASHSKCA